MKEELLKELAKDILALHRPDQPREKGPEATPETPPAGLVPLADGRTLTPETVTDELCYASYRHNARLAPHVTAEKWEAIYGPKTGEYARRLAEETAEKTEKL